MFWAYLYLAIFCAGIMLVLQLQHFSLYTRVGRDSFTAYIEANNKAAIFPAIVCALALTILSVLLLFVRPAFWSLPDAVAAIALNLANLISTAVWQGKIHGKLAAQGYDEALVRQLIQTNWIRTIALLIQSFLALAALATMQTR
jgi:hypothetical protein